jgi:hypothetical protein
MARVSLLEFPRLQKRPASSDDFDRALPTSEARVYNETALRHFLSLEARRAARSRRSLVLLVVSLEREAGKRVRFPEDVAEAVFAALNVAIREVDFAGWYREGFSVAAVLTQDRALASKEAFQAITNRISDTLSRDIPPDTMRRLRIRLRSINRSDAC